MARANKEEIKIPFGVGICGHVAKTKETVNLKNAYEVHTLDTLMLIHCLKKTDRLSGGDINLTIFVSF